MGCGVAGASSMLYVDTRCWKARLTLDTVGQKVV